jgi:hypothetical protein
VAVPVIIAESNFDAEHKSFDVYLNDSELDRNSQMAIKKTVDVTLDELKWGSAKPDAKEVENEFNRMLANSNASERVKAMMAKLYKGSGYETLIS